MSGSTRSAKNYFVRCLQTKQPISLVKDAAKDLASYAAKDLVRSSSTFTSEMKCEFLSYFGKIYYKTLHVFIFTLIIYLLKTGILNDFLRKKKLGMVFAKRFHPFCLKVIEMCSI